MDKQFHSHGLSGRPSDFFDDDLLTPLAGALDAEFKEHSELRLRAWNKFAPQEKPNILDADGVCIAADGGVSDIDELMYGLQYFYAFLIIAFVVANVYMISVADLTALLVEQDAETARAARRFLLSKWVLSTAFPQSEEYFHGHMERLVPLLEISFLFYVICRLVAYVVIAVVAPHLPQCFRGTGDCWRWHMIAEVFWNHIPQLSSFSAMRLLYYVTPTVVGTQAYVVAYLVGQRVSLARNAGQKVKAIYPLIQYLIMVVLALVIGFDAFLVKFRMAAQFVQADELRSHNVLGTFVFLFQVLGVVNLNWFVKERLFIFIFGGEDGNLEASEKARAEVWNALLARSIYKEFGLVKGTIVMLGFDDYDFQMLVLDDATKAEKMAAKSGGGGSQAPGEALGGPTRRRSRHPTPRTMTSTLMPVQVSPEKSYAVASRRHSHESLKLAHNVDQLENLTNMVQAAFKAQPIPTRGP